MGYRNEFEVEIFDECCDLGPVLRGDVFTDLLHDWVFLYLLYRLYCVRYCRYIRYWRQVVLLLSADENIGDVGPRIEFLLGCVLLEVVGESDVQVGALGGFLAPLVVGIDIGECDDLAAVEDLYPVVESGLSAGGEPDEFGHHGGADDGGLFSFYEAYDLVGILREEMLAKEALRIVPFVGRGLDAVANDLLGPGFVAYSEDCPTEYKHFSYYADC